MMLCYKYSFVIYVDVIYMTIITRRRGVITKLYQSKVSVLTGIKLVFIQSILWYVKVEIVIPKETTIVQNYT